MKKKKINNIIALLAALIVLLLIFVGVQKWNAAKEETKKAEEVESSAENKIIQELQAEPAVTGDEMDVVPFLLMGAAAGLILSGDLIMKRKTEED